MRRKGRQRLRKQRRSLAWNLVVQSCKHCKDCKAFVKSSQQHFFNHRGTEVGKFKVWQAADRSCCWRWHRMVSTFHWMVRPLRELCRTWQRFRHSEKIQKHILRWWVEPTSGITGITHAKVFAIQLSNTTYCLLCEMFWHVLSCCDALKPLLCQSMAENIRKMETENLSHKLKAGLLAHLTPLEIWHLCWGVLPWKP